MKKGDIETLGILESLFLLLFSGLYLGVHDVCNGISKSRERRLRKIQDELSARLVSEHLQSETEQFVLYHKADALKEARGDLIEALGKDWWCIFPATDTVLNPYWDAYQPRLGYWITRLILSHKGKVGADNVKNGFPLGVPAFRDRHRKLIRQIERNLNKAGANVHLVYKPGANEYDGGYMVFQECL